MNGGLGSALTIATDSPPGLPYPDTQIEVLIKEARRRRRRRRLVGAFIMAAVVLSAIVLWWMAQAPPNQVPATRLASPADGSYVAAWTDLTGHAGGFPAGSDISSMVSWHGSYYAAGIYLPQFVSGEPPSGAAGYPSQGAEPVVWTSSNARSWTVAWDEGLPVVPVPTSYTWSGILVPTSTSLLLFGENSAGTDLWQSTNGRSFEPVALPAMMRTFTVHAATWGHGRVVAVARLLEGRPTVPNDSIWTSPNGTNWQEAAVLGTASIGTVVSTTDGFLAGGSVGGKATPAVWTSPDGISWSETTLGTKGSLNVADDGSVMVAYDLGTAQALCIGCPYVRDRAAHFWWSTDTKVWSVGRVVSKKVHNGLGFNVEGSVVPVPGGFLLTGQPTTTLWFSASGKNWEDVSNAAAPAQVTVDGVFADSPGALVLTSVYDDRTWSADSVWQVTVDR